MLKTCSILVLSLLFCSALAAAEDYPVGDKPFRRYIAEGRDGKRITFYVSTPQAPGHPVPLIVWVQGTGCSSHFVRKGERIGSKLQSLLYSVARGRACILAVEKPGVEFLDDQSDDSDARVCRPEFRSEYTLDGWAATIADAIQAAQALPGIDASKTLVIGHSEGGIVAMRVSNVSPVVTHAASLSGGGPVYLFHLAEFMRGQRLDAEKEVYACWSDILKDPDSTTKFCWGQTYRQWTSFMKTSIIAEALKSHALLYFAHGTADTQNSVSGFDVLRAELAAKQRDAVFERIEGADHALDLPNQKVPEGLEAVFGRVEDWFLADVTK
ncbi:MAG: alpha/beta fold hydrolase [Acidobacteriia bacterium]|nr:alpha/beta fold hydrolase [Terriglobia bacterium]